MKAGKDTVVNKNQFALYVGRHRQTAAKYYKAYLAMVNKKEWASLTVGDIAKLDDLTVETVVIRIFE
jgi:hypothetical protein